MNWDPQSLTLIVGGRSQEFSTVLYTAEPGITEIQGISLTPIILVEFFWETLQRAWLSLWEEFG